MAGHPGTATRFAWRVRLRLLGGGGATQSLDLGSVGCSWPWSLGSVSSDPGSSILRRKIYAFTKSQGSGIPTARTVQLGLTKAKLWHWPYELCRARQRTDSFRAEACEWPPWHPVRAKLTSTATAIVTLKLQKHCNKTCKIDDPFIDLWVVVMETPKTALQGQSKVPSSQAQIFYSSTPIWSAIIAMLVLREEGMGSLGWLGGFGILAAGLVAGR